MRNKILILIPIVLLALVLVGCIPGITPAPEPEPEPTMEAEVNAVLVGEDYPWAIAWAIKNIGTKNIWEYTLTFKVDYPEMKVGYVTVTHEGEYLGIGETQSGTIKLGVDQEPKSVSVTWELSE